jgi:hypothetical protein
MFRTPRSIPSAEPSLKQKHFEQVLSQHRSSQARLAAMKIVWRNPNPINPTSFSITKTLAIERPDTLRVFYRSSSGLGVFGTMFELLVNRDAVSRAA